MAVSESQTPSAQTPVVLTTKLHAPIREGLVSRSALRRRLLDERPRRLVLVAAPAGAGKTMLLADWAGADDRRRFAWLSLDRGDNSPVAFWVYAISSLRNVAPAVGSRSLPVLQAPGTRVLQDVLPHLLNELASIDDRIVLVLDDFHLVTDPEVAEALGYLVDRAPATLELVVSTRSDPSLPVARLRARGELLELRERDLRFDLEEATELLNGILGIGVTDAEASMIHARTEGWAAGIYLAGLSLPGQEDRGEFVSAFAGDDRFVVDYLAEEVLASLPADVRSFLLSTSVLERFNAPLCDTVAGQPGSAELLARIERANLFLVPLDDRRDWYRYHHLFAELLRHELDRVEPTSARELHERAAGWYLQAGFVSEAIHHTLEAGDVDSAVELIAQFWVVLLLQAAGDRVIEGWLARVPDDVVRADFRLCIAQCYVGQSLGKPEYTERWLAAAEAAPLPAPFRDGFTSCEGAIACVRAGHLWLTGDVGQALEAGREAMQAEAGSPWEAIGVAVLGLAHAARGEWQDGTTWAQEYARIGRESGFHLNQISGLSIVAFCQAELGEWRRAGADAAHALELAVLHGIDEHWCTAHAHLALALVREQQGRVEEARAELLRSEELARRGAGPISTAWALLHRARLESATGNHAAARRALESAHQALEGAPDPGVLPGRLAEAGTPAVAHHRTGALGESLSDRELEVLQLLATSMTQREIGEALYVSLNTVKTHTRNVFRKLDVASREQAVRRARELGLI
jgi:LuxR family transcriptional regulator, maltose regulon positive regulatory protein